MKKIFTLWIAIVALALGMYAEPKDSANYSFNLQQAIDYAMNNNTRVQNATFDQAMAQSKVHEVFGAWLPQISGSFDVKDFIEIPTQVIPASAFAPTAPKDALLALKFGVNYNATASVTASQLLFSAGALLGVEATKAYLELSEKSAKRTKIETAAAISKAYYTTLVNDERMKLLEANAARLKKLMDDTKALNESGFAEKVDFDRVTVTYNNLISEKEKVQRLLGLSIVLLKYQMGMPQSANLTLTDNIAAITYQPETIGTEPSYANRIEYSLAETQKRGAFLQLKTEQRAFIPSAFLYANVGTSALRLKFDIFDPTKSWYPFAIVGGTINVPIFSGLQKAYRIQSAKVAYQKADNDLKYTQQSIELEQANSRIQLQNAAQSLETQKKNIDLAEEVYRVTKLKYEQGVGSNLEVLTAETALKESQTNYFNALFDALVAKVDYQKSIGTLIK